MIRVNKISNISFKRQLRPIEKIEQRAYIDDAKKAIGLDNLVLITHSISFPSSNTDDTGIGILSLNQGAKSYIDFAYDNGFDAISLEPSGIVRPPFYSPYESTLFSKKELVDLYELTGKKWGNILDMKTFQDIVRNKNYKITHYIKENGETKNTGQIELSPDRALHEYAHKEHRKALNLAFLNFKKKIEEGDETVLKLNKEFNSFKKKNSDYLERDAIFDVISRIYNTDDYTKWDNKLHKVLYDDNDNTYTKKEKDDEIKRLKKTYKDEIEFYQFIQFAADKQRKEFSNYASNLGQIKLKNDIKTINEAFQNGEISIENYQYLSDKIIEFKNKSKGVNLVGDKQIGYSNADIWAHPSYFTKNIFMGAPSNPMKGSMAQDWDFRFIPAEKLFNKDDSLTKEGEYLKKIMKKALEDNPGGLRIDHIIGMIDPWVYEKQDEGEITTIKFVILLGNILKELNQYGITIDTIYDLKNPMEAIQNPLSEEREILKQRGVKDFDKINEIISRNENEIEKIKYSNSAQGYRYMFNLLLEGELKELQDIGITKDTISGIPDPIKGIFDSSSRDRILLQGKGDIDFERAKEIILKNRDKIEKEYSKILSRIILPAVREDAEKQLKINGGKLSEDEIEDKTRSLLICEDLGALTEPAKFVMKNLHLKGMRNSIYTNPKDETHIYREINPNEQGNYWLIGTHDSLPCELAIEKYGEEEKKHHIDYISKELNIDSNKILSDPNPFRFINAKVAKLFSADNDVTTPNNVIINWLDFFAQRNIYNKPGISDNALNWNLRVSPSNDSFERKYYEETLPQKRGINILECLSMALDACSAGEEYKRLKEHMQEISSITQE